jgi:hypothetical protein
MVIPSLENFKDFGAFRSKKMIWGFKDSSVFSLLTSSRNRRNLVKRKDSYTEVEDSCSCLLG